MSEEEKRPHEWVLDGMNGMESVEYVWKCVHCGGTEINQSETKPPQPGRCTIPPEPEEKKEGES